ncbi:IS3 family transposase [Cohnella sp. NL03-T5]|nr:IS3 family transposase [Cohnella silvisoli]
MLQVSRSGYYKWKDRPERDRARQLREWTDQVKGVYDQSSQLYGSPKVAEKLHQQGVSVSTRAVIRIMNKQQWRSRTIKKYNATTNSKHHFPVQVNVLNQEFTASKPNEKWITDITYGTPI